MRSTLVSVLLALFALALYWQSTSFDFAYDDFWRIHQDTLVTSPEASSVTILQSATAPGNLYRPLTTLSFRLNYELAGESAFGFHITNILLYALICALLFALLKKWRFGNGFAATVTLLFVVHPLHIEAVANVAGRSELLAALFGISAVLALLNPLPSSVKLSFAGICLLCAALAKETGYAYFVIAPLAVWYQGDKALKPQKLLWLLLPLCCALALRLNALGEHVLVSEASALGTIAENPIAHLSFYSRVLPALSVLGHYVQLLLVPWPLSADYSMMPNEFFQELYSLVGLLRIVLILAFLLLLYRKRQEHWAFFGFWFVLALLPGANIFAPTGTIKAERLTFSASIGFIPFFAQEMWGAVKESRFSKNLALGLAATAISLFLLVTLQRLPVWRDNSTLFQAGLRTSPKSPKAMFHLGLERHKQKEWRKAELHYRRALQLNPHYINAAVYLAESLREQGKLQQLDYWYQRILELNPDQETRKKVHAGQAALRDLQERK